ncbi:MAG: hypothetical protein LBH37_03920 [Oscillospiraceae bacterium]|jgi:predicted transposase/invertase (TIGR01784 family)|nr:hypothetical protein [Oscillospiraceae bacterium]
MSDKANTEIARMMCKLISLNEDESVMKATMKKNHDEFYANMKISVEKGIEKSRKEGIEEGRKMGRIESSIQIAINLLEEGFDKFLISKTTGLPIEKIESLKIS